ncbi:hypothetical protein AQI88_26380 [Streptomyces cellostaticus]|uniref:Uncharacterized protein n=1 Tax=Streptomyces cellostaticus TaxID=67285 RepID=A0A101NI61_9ACTN|nr:hypothetical protein [Streptomyces cellostaticus]KUM93507.1 hypothetical protein AQI88_26380 [Streptomyces cellostaticus]GHI10159.1 hypothetical protein Scel_84800 [Streptomyces cellostaticus]
MAANPGAVPAPSSAPRPSAAAAAGAALTACDDYLAAADEAGLLHRIDGLVYVAGEYHEPLTGVDQCLVEYADPRLLRAAPAFLAALFARFPECTEAIVRVAGADDPHPALTPRLSYLSLPVEAGRAPQGAETPGLTVALDEAREHDAAVHDWLRRAMVTAAADRGLTTRPEAVRAAVDALLDSPGRRTFVVYADGRDQPAGHATLCVDAHDDPSGTDFVELVDILIDDPLLRSAAVTALVQASARLADGLGLPLVGNVCHGLDEAGRSGVVAAALEARGWRRTHQYRHGSRPGTEDAGASQDQEETP